MVYGERVLEELKKNERADQDEQEKLSGKQRQYEAKQEELTLEEKKEREVLRQEYIQSYRESMRARLENIIIERPDGTREKLKHKDKK